MNYFYVLNGKYVIGFTLSTTPEELKNDIPEGFPFFYYEPGDDIQKIAAEKDPAGIGTGTQIDYDCFNMGKDN